MKRIFFILSIALILGIVYIAVMNFDNPVDIHYLKGYAYTLDASNLYVSKTMGLGLFTILCFALGIFAGAGTVALFLGLQGEKMKAYKRELEKTCVSGEASASKVKVLEAKIKTLENAFSTVVDERTKMEVQIKELSSEIENLKG